MENSAGGLKSLGNPQNLLTALNAFRTVATMTGMDEAVKKKRTGTHGNDGGGFIWFLGAIGAAVYYVQHAESFGQGVLGILKSLVWPGVVVYHLLQSFGV